MNSQRPSEQRELIYRCGYDDQTWHRMVRPSEADQFDFLYEGIFINYEGNPFDLDDGCYLLVQPK